MNTEWTVLTEPPVEGYTEMEHGRDLDSYPDKDEVPSQTPRIHAQDWDCLAVLDACRWDALKAALADTDVTVEPVRTPGNHTPIWLRETFEDFEDPDLTYISGTPRSDPQSPKADDQEVVPDLTDRLDLRQCTGAFYSDPFGCWDPSLGTARPRMLTRKASYASLPVGVHYMQPHAPFIGDLRLGIGGRCSELDKFGDRTSVYGANSEDIIDIETVRIAYYLNLVAVLEHVDSLFDRFRRRDEDVTAVITADHGEVLQERGCSHGTMHHTQNRVVPWAVFEL